MGSDLKPLSRGAAGYAGPQTVGDEKFVVIEVKDGAKETVIAFDSSKQAEGVAKRVHRGDVVSEYEDKQGHTVLYNETQRYVARSDGKGHWKTEPLLEQKLDGKVTAIQRDADPKHKDEAVVSIAGKDGQVTKVHVTDKPGQRIEKLMHVGDQVDGSMKDVPGGRDTVLHDKTRHFALHNEHDKAPSIANDPPERAISRGRGGISR